MLAHFEGMIVTYDDTEHLDPADELVLLWEAIERAGLYGMVCKAMSGDEIVSWFELIRQPYVINRNYQRMVCRTPSYTKRT